MSAAQSCSLTFIGTATTLLRFGPFALLTDPNFLDRGQFAYLGKGLVSRRRTEPGVRIEDLPAPDAIVLSHMHGDHWDRVARTKLDHTTHILTTPDAARALARQGFGNSEGLQTWATLDLDKDGHRLRVTAMPGRHAWGLAQHLLPPVMGSMLEYESPGASTALRLYITGDTLLVEDIRQIPQRYGDIDIAILHLGGTTLPGGLMVTMDAREGADMMQLIDPRTAVPVHYDDYGVYKSPLSDFRREIENRGLNAVVRYVARGETITLIRSA